MPVRTLIATLLSEGLFLALGLAVYGEARTSSTYALTTETIDAGGHRSESSHYSIDSSLGNPGGEIATNSGATHVSKSGFSGQLYEIEEIAITLFPSQIDEGQAGQLGANAVLDDATLIVSDPAKVAWEVVSGPLVSISADGLATADTVYENTSAIVGAVYRGNADDLEFTVLNISDDDFQTYGGDGLPDHWQVEFFGIDGAGAGPNEDSDGDGIRNLREFAFATSPVDRASGHAAAPVAFAATDPDEGNDEYLTITVKTRPAGSGLRYIAEVAGDLAGQSWLPLGQTVGAPVGPDGDGLFTVTYRDNEPIANHSLRFIRIRVEPE